MLGALGLRAKRCADENPACSGWAKAGQCESNKGFMQKSCALSCDSCSKYEPAMPAPGVAFDALDRDGDGTISLAELKSQLRWSSAHSRGEKSKLSKERVKDIMYEVSGVLTDASKDDVVYATCLAIMATPSKLEKEKPAEVS